MGRSIERIETPSGRPGWRVSGHAEARTLLTDVRLGSSPSVAAAARRSTRTGASGRPAGSEKEYDAHALWRRAMNTVFSAVAFERLGPTIRALAERTADELSAGPAPAALTDRYALPLTSRVTCALLGLPEADIADFRRWAEAGPGPSDPLSAYVRELVGRRRGQPGEDAISMLLAAGSGSRGVHEGRVTNLVTGMLAFGRQTPAAVISTGVRLLLTHPDQRHRLDADRGLLPGAVEELLRLARLPAAMESGVHRYAYADVAIAGVTIGAGDLVVLDLTAANKDERVFPDPDRFDPTRSPNPHLTFGHGYYMCNFARLARAQIGTGLTTLLDRVPALRLVGPADGDPLVAW